LVVVVYAGNDMFGYIDPVIGHGVCSGVRGVGRVHGRAHGRVQRRG
jgi:hypothetical protein